MDTCGERIKALRLMARMEQKELADKLGYKSETTVSKWENNKSIPTGKKLMALVTLLNTDVAYLLNGKLPDYSSNAHRASVVRIPIIGEIACGAPIFAEEHIADYREEAEETLPSGTLFYLQAKGDSMQPTIPDRSFVLIREQPTVEYGEIAAVLLNDDTEATLKRVKKQGALTLLVADNTAYDPIIVTPDQTARIIGKAVKVSFDL